MRSLQAEMFELCLDGGSLEQKESFELDIRTGNSGYAGPCAENIVATICLTAFCFRFESFLV